MAGDHRLIWKYVPQLLTFLQLRKSTACHEAKTQCIAETSKSCSDVQLSYYPLVEDASAYIKMLPLLSSTTLISQDAAMSSVNDPTNSKVSIASPSLMSSQVC